jgi:error-prone DNA polymerase
MGWQNPAIPWRELERRLSGRPDTAAYDLNGNPREPDGGDSPAWSRKRGVYVPPPVESASGRRRFGSASPR